MRVMQITTSSYPYKYFYALVVTHICQIGQVLVYCAIIMKY